MAATVKGVPARILALLVERWPITLRQVCLALRLRPEAVGLAARRLASQGLVALEPLGEETYIALTGAGVQLLDLPPKDAQRLRERSPLPPPPRDDHDPAFG